MKAKLEWVSGPHCTDDEWAKVEAILATRGWMSLNRPTSTVLLAYGPSGELLGFNVVQMMPYAGPLFVIPSARGSGLAEELVDEMMIFLAKIKARGFMAIAQSPHTEQLCVKLGLKKVEAPIYMMGGTS